MHSAGMIAQGPAGAATFADVDRRRRRAAIAMRQDRRAGEARVADPAVAEDLRQAVDHDASPASAGNLDLEVEGGGFAEGGERQEHHRTLVQHASLSLETSSDSTVRLASAQQ